MKRGPKPGNGKYIRVSATIEKTLKAEIDSRTENLSGYLNQAGWDKVRKDAKRPPLGRDKSYPSLLERFGAIEEQKKFNKQVSDKIERQVTQKSPPRAKGTEQ